MNESNKTIINVINRFMEIERIAYEGGKIGRIIEDTENEINESFARIYLKEIKHFTDKIQEKLTEIEMIASPESMRND